MSGSTNGRRTLVVLGAGADQVFLIRTARELGLAVLALDRNPAAPGFALADEHAPISTRDVPSIVAHLEERARAGVELAGVITMGSDIPDAVSAVAARFALPGLPAETAALAVDKLAMKVRLAERGVRVPWFAEVRSARELRACMRQRGPDLVLKPVDRSGSRGVFRLERASPLDELFERARDFSYIGRVMVEEYLPGPQISTETVLWHGRAVTPGFADREYTPELHARFKPQVMENGGWLPSRFTGAERAAIEREVERAARALGIERGTAKGDVVWTQDGPAVIEIAARLSGGDFCESLVPLSSGVNYVRAAVRIAIGEEPDWSELEPRRERHVANRYFFTEPGVLARTEGLDAVRAQPWIEKLELWVTPGGELPEIRSHADRAGVFVAVADERAELERRIAWVYETIRIVTRPGARTTPAGAR